MVFMMTKQDRRGVLDYQSAVHVQGGRVQLGEVKREGFGGGWVEGINRILARVSQWLSLMHMGEVKFFIIHQE